MTRIYFSVRFWIETAERAIKTIAQVALLVIGQDVLSFDVFNADLANVAGMAAGGALLSILTSIASAPIGPTGPSTV